MKSLSALEAEQWITIRSIFLIDRSFHFFYLFSFCERKITLAIQYRELCQSLFSVFKGLVLKVDRRPCTNLLSDWGNCEDSLSARADYAAGSGASPLSPFPPPPFPLSSPPFPPSPFPPSPPEVAFFSE